MTVRRGSSIVEAGAKQVSSEQAMLIISRTCCLLMLLGLAACGGTKVLKEPKSLVITEPLASNTDQHLSATLDWVIFRDGPGTWAKNVDWDEYMFRVRYLGADSVQLTSIVVMDSLGTAITPRTTRRQLVKGTKETKRRYKGEGLRVKAGVSGGVLLGASVVAAAGTSGVGAVAMAGGSAAAAGAVAVVVLVPVLAVGGLVRGVNNSKVNGEIEIRHTLMPVKLSGDEEKVLHIFFPLSPSPQQVEIAYLINDEEQTLFIDTRAALDGLHLIKAE